MFSSKTFSSSNTNNIKRNFSTEKYLRHVFDYAKTNCLGAGPGNKVGPGDNVKPKNKVGPGNKVEPGNEFETNTI